MNCKKRWVDISGRIGITFYLLLWCSVNASAATGSEIENASKFTHHAMTVTLDPATSGLKVTTQITLPDSAKAGQEIQFLLHKDLQVQSAQQNLREQPVILPALKKMLDTAAVPMKEYRVTLPAGAKTLTLSYHGKISHALDENDGGTPGLIASDGVFLAHSTAWYPLFNDDELVTFDVQIRLPKDWGAVSQGELRKDEVTDQQRVMQWVELHPQDDIYIVASRYHEYQQEIDGIKAMVFLRARDEALADRYIKATGQYIALYNELIGPYPYKKFALVENFWETGYGMPSFTLLGSRVIRFPFIIYTSYPHEILHNYWGNGVFVDYESGNWSEGLTAYLADHLFKEQRGEGAEYRRSVLQKYTDFVNESRDFPLTEFRSRHSSATEAVGYGKTLMLFHMLRLQLGDEKFKTALQAFYQQFQFRFAAFADVAKVFSGAADRTLTAFFQQWVNQAGAPSLSVSEAIVKHNDNRYQLGFKLTQSQPEAAYQLNVPVVIYFQDQLEPHQTTLQLNSKQQKYSLEFNRKPVIIDIDPAFDIFRRLDSREIPAAISQGFGDDKPLLILPGKANPQQLTAYRALAEQWQKQQMQSLEIKTDAELTELPADRSIWILGWDNRFKEAVVKDLKSNGLTVAEKAFGLMEQSFDKTQHALMVATRHPQNLNKTLLWLSGDNLDAMPGLARKLPHYRKYSYLVFKGDAPDNIVKGQWEITDSPMRVVLDKEAAKNVVKVKPRAPLVSPSR
jgi:aminopeptidase N